MFEGDVPSPICIYRNELEVIGCEDKVNIVLEEDGDVGGRERAHSSHVVHTS